MINLFLIIENERSIETKHINQTIIEYRTLLILFVINPNDRQKRSSAYET
jgi:hypothetical protein